MPKEKLDKKEYQKLGEMLVSIGEIGYADKKELYKSEFIKGIFRGFGSVLGATLIIAVVFFLLSLLGEVPFVGDIADSVRQTIKQPSE